MFRWCPWADVLYAMDAAWWAVYLQEVRRKFKGRKVSPLFIANDVSYVDFWHGSNSGQGAIELAKLRGAEKIILLGYDAQLTDGKTHCHGDHPAGLGNAGAVNSWPEHMALTAAKGQAQIINCSRQTALTCFPRAPLETVLECT